MVSVVLEVAQVSEGAQRMGPLARPAGKQGGLPGGMMTPGKANAARSGRQSRQRGRGVRDTAHLGGLWESGSRSRRSSG